MQKRKVDETLARVGSQALRICLKIIILVCLVGYVGIETASITAVIASLGVGISLAVQGTLSNFAGGVIIIVMRPFKIGDFITSSGESGTVEDIKLFYTHIVTTDNRAVVIPNGTLANNVIVNASAKDTRRCDITVSAAYGSDIEKVKEVISKVCADNELIFKDPAPFVMLSKMGESSLDFVVRAWCKKEDYWTVNFYLLDSIKKAFDANGIEIPFNQLDVTIKNKPTENK
jgi:small conductance mechanosensitive channel